MDSGDATRVKSNAKRSALATFVRPIEAIPDKFISFIFPQVFANEMPSRPTANLPFITPDYDKVVGRRVLPPSLAPDTETGWDRVKEMFSTNKYGVPGPEWMLIMNATYCGLVAGAIIGGVSAGRIAKDNYIYKNQATTYDSEIQARRALQNRITIGLGAGAIKLGLKTGGLTSLYTFTASLLSVYRGKTTITDFIAAGTISGFLWRFTMGPKAALISSILGSILGIFAGSVCMLSFYLTGTTMEEVRYWHYRAILDVTVRKENLEETESSSGDQSKDSTV